jgi:hypothetical protein
MHIIHIAQYLLTSTRIETSSDNDSSPSKPLENIEDNEENGNVVLLVGVFSGIVDLTIHIGEVDDNKVAKYQSAPFYVVSHPKYLPRKNNDPKPQVSTADQIESLESNTLSANLELTKS